MSRLFKQGCYNGSICYGGIIQCIQGDITQESFDKIIDLMDAYCDIQEVLIEERIHEISECR